MTILCEYFYKNSIPYVTIQQELFNNTTYISKIVPNALIIGEQGDNVIFTIDEIAHYCVKDFKVYYIIEEIRAMNQHYLSALARRQNMLFLLL